LRYRLPREGIGWITLASGETRHETQLERLDRNLEELTGELRVVVTGVQVLFAFLLIVPFNSCCSSRRSCSVSRQAC